MQETLQRYAQDQPRRLTRAIVLFLTACYLQQHPSILQHIYIQISEYLPRLYVYCSRLLR